MKKSLSRQEQELVSGYIDATSHLINSYRIRAIECADTDPRESFRLTWRAAREERDLLDLLRDLDFWG